METEQENSILIVDDSLREVRNIIQFLCFCKWVCRFVKTGEECLELLKSGKKYKIVLLDAQIPGHWSGIRTLREILAFDPDQCVAFLTGKEIYAEQAMAAIRAGAADYIQKPPKDMDVFIARLNTAYEEHRAFLKMRTNDEYEKALMLTRVICHQVNARVQAAFGVSMDIDLNKVGEEREKIHAVQENLRHADRYLQRSVYFDWKSDEKTSLTDAVKRGMENVKEFRQLRYGARYPVKMEGPSGPQDLVVRMGETAVQLITEILVGNAAEAIHSSPEKERKDGVVQVSLVDEGETALLVVEDNGPGISKEELGKVFEPGYSTKGGMGLGLFLVKKTVDEIWVDKSEPSGAKICVRFKK